MTCLLIAVILLWDHLNTRGVTRAYTLHLDVCVCVCVHVRAQACACVSELKKHGIFNLPTGMLYPDISVFVADKQVCSNCCQFPLFAADQPTKKI